MQLHKPITTVILFIITAILVFLFAWPKYQEFGDAKITLAKKQAEYNGESLYYQKISEITQQIDDKKEMLDKIDSSLPQNGAIAPIIYFFQKKGAETGLIVKSITFSNAAAPTAPTTQRQSLKATQKPVKNITFSLNLTGNYQGLKNFLASLESSARLFEVNIISLSPLQSLQNSSKTQIKLQTYDLKLQVTTHTY